MLFILSGLIFYLAINSDFRCYVGSVSRQQWRPCSDFYYPYQTHNRNAPHWPISYVHRQGPPNNTAHSQRQPSLVDSFFEQLRFDQSRMSLNTNASNGHLYSHNNSSLPDFQVVKLDFFLDH